MANLCIIHDRQNIQIPVYKVTHNFVGDDLQWTHSILVTLRTAGRRTDMVNLPYTHLVSMGGRKVSFVSSPDTSACQISARPFHAFSRQCSEAHNLTRFK